LQEVDGIDTDSIKTDVGNTIVSFQVEDGFNLDTSLEKFAEHDHLKGWSRSEN